MQERILRAALSYVRKAPAFEVRALCAAREICEICAVRAVCVEHEDVLPVTVGRVLDFEKRPHSLFILQKISFLYFRNITSVSRWTINNENAAVFNIKTPPQSRTSEFYLKGTLDPVKYDIIIKILNAGAGVRIFKHMRSVPDRLQERAQRSEIYIYKE